MRKYIIGTIFGFLIAISANVFAAVGDKVEAVFAQFTYVVNGEQKSLDSPVLVYDGNSYLRTTQISTMLGFDVTYKANARTIEFSNKEPAEQPMPTEPTEPKSTSKPTTEPNSTTTNDQASSQSPEPSTNPETSASPEPSPSPDPKIAECKAIRDNYAYKIAMVSHSGDTLSKQRAAVLQLEYARDQALSSAGC